MTPPANALLQAFAQWSPSRWAGRIQNIAGDVMVSEGPPCAVGDVLRVCGASDDVEGLAQVVALEDRHVRSMMLTPGIRVTTDTVLRKSPAQGLVAPIGEGLLGRVLDAFGEPLDGNGPLGSVDPVLLSASPPNPMTRMPLTERFTTGITAIDGLLPLASGQRIGLFAGSGVGKSVLLGMIAQGNSADRTVICLVGERGREVSEFIHDNVGPEGLSRSVVVVATSDQPAPARITAAEYATRIAEWFRDQGRSVLLIMDSLTRYAMALREVGLASGEMPVARGYPPSVFTALPKLAERTGSDEHGAITAVYTVLVEGDDMQEPIADTVRGILDGHIVLSRKLAESGQYPAIDPAASISRLAIKVAKAHEHQVARRFIELWASYQANADLIRMGAYVAGSDDVLDQAVAHFGAMREALRQSPGNLEPPDPVAVMASAIDMAYEGPS